MSKINYKDIPFVGLYLFGFFLLSWHIYRPILEYSLYAHLGLILVAYILADLVTGLVHATLDHWPLGRLEPYLCSVRNVEDIPECELRKAGRLSKYGLDFRLHHLYPSDILKKNFLELAWSVLPFNALYLLTFSLLIIFFIKSPAFSYIILLSSCFLWVAQYVHQRAHTSNNSKVIKILQKSGLFISVKVHAKHHHMPNSMNFSLLNGLSNHLINRLFSGFNHHINQ